MKKKVLQNDENDEVYHACLVQKLDLKYFL